jgi:CRISPR associated protein Cas1
VVAAKIAAQLRLVIRYQRNYPDRLEADAADRLRALLEKVPAGEEVASLQGLEGAAAAVYYRQFGSMLTAVGLPGRKKRPSTDPAAARKSIEDPARVLPSPRFREPPRLTTCFAAGSLATGSPGGWLLRPTRRRPRGCGASAARCGRRVGRACRRRQEEGHKGGALY